MDKKYLLLFDLKENKVVKLATGSSKELINLVYRLRVILERNGWKVVKLDEEYIAGVSAYMFMHDDEKIIVVECYD